MTKMLASVSSLDEARLVYQAGADIIDLKQPASGALGALPIATVKAICEQRSFNTPVSATIGDLPMQPELISASVETMSATGVDFVKIGFFPDGDWNAVALTLAERPRPACPLIAVLFADTKPDTAFIATLSKAGFAGVMLDTMNKELGSLTDILSFPEIESFVNTVRKNKMLCGLAGSLAASDIRVLLPLRPDYLGFRGALCVDRSRTALLDPVAVKRVRQALDQGKIEHEKF